MTGHESSTPQTSKWRYPLAGWFVLAAVSLCFVSYLAKPTTSLFSDEGAAQLHRMAWYAMGGAACLAAAGVFAAYEVFRRHQVRAEAHSPIPRREYILLLQAMLLQARQNNTQPVKADDVRQLMELIRPTGVLDTMPQLKGE